MTESTQVNVQKLFPQEHRLFSGLGKEFQVLLFPFNMPKAGKSKSTEEGIEIVLIEDTDANASLTLDLIEASKYKCMSVVKFNGIDALNYLRQSHDSAIAERTLLLLNPFLQGISGLNLLTELRRNEQLKAVPVAILTASTKPIHIAASAQQQVISYMVKPNNLKQFNILVKAFDELLGCLFSDSQLKTNAERAPSNSPTFIRQSNERSSGNAELR